MLKGLTVKGLFVAPTTDEHVAVAQVHTLGRSKQGGTGGIKVPPTEALPATGNYPPPDRYTDAFGLISLVLGCIAVVCLFLGCFTAGLSYVVAVPLAMVGVLTGWFGRSGSSTRIAGLTLNVVTLIPASVLAGCCGALLAIVGLTKGEQPPQQPSPMQPTEDPANAALTIRLRENERTMKPGDQEFIIFTVQRTNFSGKVEVSFEKIPEGVGPNPNKTVVDAKRNDGEMRISVYRSAKPGTVRIPVRAVFKNLTGEDWLRLTIIDPASATVPEGR